MGMMNKRLETMDDLASRFARESFERTVMSCDDIEELRKVTLSLIGSFYAQRTLLMRSMREALPHHSNNAP